MTSRSDPGGLTLPPSTSASQPVAYAMCPRRYAFSYVLGFEPEFRSVALLLGSAVHSALGWFFGERIAGRSPTVASAEEIVSADVLAASVGVPVRWKEATEESVEAEARRLVRLYLGRHGDQAVTAVEDSFSVDLADHETGEVMGRTLKGYFDLVLRDRSVVEVKTAARSWSEADLARHLQVGAYAFAWNSLHGGPSKLAVHVIVKLKREPRVDVFQVERGEAELRWWLEAARAIEAAIESRHFPPAPGPLCHDCEYGKACAAWTDEPSDAAHADSVRKLRVARDDRAPAFDL